MSAARLYRDVVALARERRFAYRVDTAAFGLRELRSIYAAEKVRIDSWPALPKRIKAIYMCTDDDYSVAIQPSLPIEPKLFALVHELKHHYCDRPMLRTGCVSCGDYNANREIEIAAEVFAAEFIYPEAECAADLTSFQAGPWTGEALVQFKRQCRAAVSYTFLRKRLERLNLIRPGQFAKIQFKKLEDRLFGVPIYRQSWFKQRRRRRQTI